MYTATRTIPCRTSIRLVGAALAGAALAAGCADRGPTAPARVRSLDPATQLATPGGGKPVRFPLVAEPVTYPAGVGCSFPLAGEPVLNRQVVKEFPADANGDVVQLISGRFIARFTNLETGESITVNVSGPARVVLHPDGSFTIEYLGRSTFTFFPTDIPAGPLTVLNSGRMVIDFTPTGQAVLVSRTGHQEDLCAALS